MRRPLRSSTLIVTISCSGKQKPLALAALVAGTSRGMASTGSLELRQVEDSEMVTFCDVCVRAEERGGGRWWDAQNLCSTSRELEELNM